MSKEFLFLLLLVPLIMQAMEESTRPKSDIIKYVNMLIENKQGQGISNSAAQDIKRRADAVRNKIGKKSYKRLTQAWSWFDLQEFFLNWEEAQRTKRPVEYQGDVRATIHAARVVTYLTSKKNKKKKKEKKIDLSSLDFVAVLMPLLDKKSKVYDF
jgi:hypothetical protein